MKEVRAVVRWVPEEEGGRHRPPSGSGPLPYSTLVRFTDGEGSRSPGVAWSLVVEKVEALSGPDWWTADVHFLAPDAPDDALRPGRGFGLYEGHKCVALGQIVGDLKPSREAATVSSARTLPPA